MVTKAKAKKLDSLVRVDNWQVDLLAHVDREQYRAFDYGTFDCALWAADCLLVQTGYDIAERWRGKYKSLAAGMRLVKKDGYEDHIDVFASQLYEVAGSRAQFGDLVVLDGIDGMMSVGICMGHIIYAPTMSGIGVALLVEAKRTFRVIRVEGDGDNHD